MEFAPSYQLWPESTSTMTITPYPKPLPHPEGEGEVRPTSHPPRPSPIDGETALIKPSPIGVLGWQSAAAKSPESLTSATGSLAL